MPTITTTVQVARQLSRLCKASDYTVRQLAEASGLSHAQAGRIYRAEPVNLADAQVVARLLGRKIVQTQKLEKL